jgi:hypothetical protein
VYSGDATAPRPRPPGRADGDATRDWCETFLEMLNRFGWLNFPDRLDRRKNTRRSTRPQSEL